MNLTIRNRRKGTRRLAPLVPSFPVKPRRVSFWNGCAAWRAAMADAFSLSPKAPSHALATLRDKVRLPAPQRRRALVVATATGTLLGLLCAIAAVPFETSWQVDIPFLVLGSLAVAGPIIGLVAGVVWNRRVALHRALDSVRLSLQHGHWGIVALPATRRQWRQIARLLRQDEREHRHP